MTGRSASPTPTRTHSGERESEKQGWMRRLYNWVVGWAERPGGPIALFLAALAEASFFPVPPDPLLLALSVGSPRRALRFAAICTAGSVIGGIIGYGIGLGLWALVSDFFFSNVPGFDVEVFERVQRLYETYDFWAVFVAGLTPIPYKVFTLAAGAFEISFPVFVLASVTSRGARFFLLAWLIHRFGPEIQRLIERHFDRLAWLFLILLVLGFVVVKFVV